MNKPKRTNPPVFIKKNKEKPDIKDFNIKTDKYKNSKMRITKKLI